MPPELSLARRIDRQYDGLARAYAAEDQLADRQQPLSLRALHFAANLAHPQRAPI